MKKFDVTDDDLSCFDEDQKEQILQLFSRAAASEEEEVDSDDDLTEVPSDHRRLIAKDQAKMDRFLKVWKNNGVVDGLAEPITLEELITRDKSWHGEYMKEAKDAGFTSTDHPLLINRVVSEVVKEAIEPGIVLTPLLQRINFTHGTQLTFPAVGAIAAADIAEGQEYPERSLDFAGQVVATIGKSGVAVKMTDEMIRYSLFDVMSMHLRAAGRAMIRWKEQKVSDMLIENAGGSNTLIDNSSLDHQSSTGRDSAGAYNGTLTLDDIFRAYSTMVNRGFSPNLLIMNPFAWEIFADEAIARALGFVNGNAVWSAVQGSLGNAPSWSNGGGMNGLLQNTQVDSPQNLATTFTNVPSIFPVPFRIIVSPYMPINTTTKRTDIIFADSNELGVLVVDEEITTEEWDDPARDIRKVKLRERYAVAAINNGQGMGILKDISLAKGFDFARKLAPNLVTVDLTGEDGWKGDV